MYQTTTSRRGSCSSDPADVSAQNVKLVKDSHKFWYKPHISREEAISLLRHRPTGTFVVRDSNSFPGAFGLALKVSTPPVMSARPDPTGDELVRHFLIEPTSKGVKLKGYSNEPVFGSLSALVYQVSMILSFFSSPSLLHSGKWWWVKTFDGSTH
jgi:tensin